MSFEDMQNFSRLIQSLNVIHMEGGGAVEPVELPAETRHLDTYRAFITLTDKPWSGYALGGFRAEDGIAMAAIALGVDRDALAEKPAVITVINSNSPLRLDGPMSEGLMAYAAAGQPFAAGTPEYAQAVLIGCQLARRYQVPYRTSNVTSANAPDAQAAWASMMSLCAAYLGQASIIKQGAGRLEGGLAASYEKFILDAEMLQMMQAFLVPPAVDEAAFGIEAIADVGPGGHFFGTAHTLARYETAFYSPLVSDWRNFETWSEHGSPSAAQHANRVWKQLLNDYEEPPLDPAITDELDEYVARRKAVLEASA